MNRRRFLKTSAAVAALSAITPARAAAAVATAGAPRESMTLEFAPYELMLKHAFNLARYSRTTTPDVQVKIHYQGFTGYGEASMPPYLGESVDSVCRYLSRVDLSRFSSPFEMEGIHDYLDSLSPDGDMAAKAAVDIALHDLVGKLTSQPHYRLKGLDPSLAPATSFTIGIDTEEVVRQKVIEAEPYSVLKVKMGLDNDRETIEVIRSMTDRPLYVDVNQGWTEREKALEMCHWLNERGCLFVEQPMPKEQIDDIAWLTERSPLPIVADEAIKRLADVKNMAGVYSGINIKLMKCGGLHEAYKMIVAARALGLKVMLGCMTETSCAVSAAAQLAPMVDWADLDGNLLIANDCFDGMKIKDGKVTLTSLPGIGVTPL